MNTAMAVWFTRTNTRMFIRTGMSMRAGQRRIPIRTTAFQDMNMRIAVRSKGFYNRGLHDKGSYDREFHDRKASFDDRKRRLETEISALCIGFIRPAYSVSSQAFSYRRSASSHSAYPSSAR